jgi:ribosomal protein L37AE/L43A
VNAEPHKVDAPVLASPSKSTVEAGDLFRRNSGYGEKEEKELGDASMKMSSILGRVRDWFTCPSCSTTNYWDSFSSGEQLKCKKCGLELEKGPDGSVKPSSEAATGQSANDTGNEGRGSDDDSQWADTESEVTNS